MHHAKLTPPPYRKLQSFFLTIPFLIFISGLSLGVLIWSSDYFSAENRIGLAVTEPGAYGVGEFGSGAYGIEDERPIDTTPPTITLLLPATDSSTTVKRPEFRFRSSEVGTCSLLIDNAVQSHSDVQADTDAILIPGTDLTVGAHSWAMNCTDTSSNAATSEGRSITIAEPSDTTRPSVNLISPADAATSQDGTPDFSFVSVDNKGSIANCTLLINGIANGTDTSIQHATAQSLTPTSNMTNGVHQWNVRCMDPVGNAASGAARSITIAVPGGPVTEQPPAPDTSSPIVQLLAPANATNSTGQVTFNFNVSDESAVTNCSLLLNNAPHATSTSVQKGAAQSFTATLAVGTYEWSVLCFDAANNSATAPLPYIYTVNAQLSGSTPPPGGNGGGGGGGSGGGGGGGAPPKTYTLNTLAQNRPLTLYRSDKVVFTVRAEQHSVTLLDVTRSNVRIRVASTPQEFTLTPGQSIAADVTNDTNADVRVTLQNLEYPKANLTIQYIEQPVNRTNATNTTNVTNPFPPVQNVTNTTNTTNQPPVFNPETPPTAGGPSQYWLLALVLGIFTLIIFYFIEHERRKEHRAPLETFIRRSLDEGHSKEDVLQALMSHGWPDTLIAQGFAAVHLAMPVKPAAVKQVSLASTALDPLHEYIRQQLSKGRNIYTIRSNLINSGWREEDVDPVLSTYTNNERWKSGTEVKQ